MARGEIVIVRAFRDEPLIRRVWSENENVVWVCGEEHYNALIKGYGNEPKVGFFRQDVFVYDEGSAILLFTIGNLVPSLWRNLAQWSSL